MGATAIKVLLIEDSKMDSHLLGVLLRDNTSSFFKIHHVERLADALYRLQNEKFDVVPLPRFG